MKTSEVHIGDKIGQLIVLDKTRKVTSGWNRTVFKCKCSCGNICYYPAMQLHPNKKCSNGVHRMKYIRPEGLDDKDFKKIYKTWLKIRSRCENHEDKDFPRYGGRGITLCNEWHNFNNFLDWYWKKSNHEILPFAKQSVDRINVNDDYSPQNCRLVDAITQANNRRSNTKTEIKGELLSLSEIARKYHFTMGAIDSRYESGKRGEDLISPLNKPQKFNINGIMLTLKQISDQYHISMSALYKWTQKDKSGKTLCQKIPTYKPRRRTDK